MVSIQAREFHARSYRHTYDNLRNVCQMHILNSCAFIRSHAILILSTGSLDLSLDCLGLRSAPCLNAGRLRLDER